MANQTHHCINCLLDTERKITDPNYVPLTEGDRFWYENYHGETEELRKILKKYSPESLLELGAGTGRVIQLALTELPQLRVTGIESNPLMFNFVSERFSNDDNIDIINSTVADYFSMPSEYDLGVCMMNTFGNFSDFNIMTKILQSTGIFIFTLYNEKFDPQREVMYQSRGHRNFSYAERTYHFDDSWVNGLSSRSFNIEEIKSLVSNSGGIVESLQEVGLLYFCVARSKAISSI